MSEYKAYIERSWIMDSWKIYVTGRFGDRREYVTLKDGKAISTIIDECQMIPDGGHLLELPDSVFQAIKERIITDVEQQGGAPTQQSLRGEIKRLENEVNWLREKYSAL